MEKESKKSPAKAGLFCVIIGLVRKVCMMQDILNQYLHIILAFLIFMALLEAFVLFYVYKKLKLLSRGASGESLESKILKILSDNEVIKNDNSKIKKLLAELIQKDKESLKSAHVVKFNPFSQSGHGKQSYALAVLSESGKGFILSTLSIRGETHVFVKEVENFDAHALTEEEKEALEKAKEKVAKN